MNIVLSQYRPLIRLWKWAITLEKMGHNISILYMGECDPMLDWNKFNVVKYNPKRLPICDVHIAFNTNVRPLSFLYQQKTIQAVGDLKAFYDEYKVLESRAMRDARACVFVSDVQMYQAMELHPCIKEKSHVVYNGLVDEMTQLPKKPKIKDEFINIVYSGCVTDKKGNHRNISKELTYLASLDSKIKLHLYYSPRIGCSDSIRSIPNIVVHEPVKPTELVSEMAMYDIGLILLNEESIGGKSIADSMMPNKLSEYLVAGIPIVCKKYKQMEMFNRDKGCIFFIKEDGDVLSPIKEALKYKGSGKKFADEIAYKNQIVKINSILNSI